jgi:hypothetical protein
MIKRSSMTFALLAGLLIALLAIPLFGIASAQDDAIPLSYNDPVSGEMTDDAYEFTYTFTGKAGDLVILRASQITALSDFDNPVLTLDGPDGEPIADTTGSFRIGSALLAVQLEADGQHSVRLTRQYGPEGSTAGEFTMEAILAVFLDAEFPVEGRLDPNGREQYYAVNVDFDFALGITITRSGVPLALAVNVLDQRSSGLSSIASAGGSAMTEATIGVFDAKALYIVTVDKPLFSFSFGAGPADYVIDLIPVN